MIGLLVVLVLAVVAAAGGELHGRRVAYRRVDVALARMTAQIEVMTGRWSAARVAAAVIEQAGIPARPAALDPDVALDDIEETDADRAFDPATCPDGCEDCAEEVAAPGAATGPVEGERS